MPQQIIFFDGPDRCGKTNIGKEIAFQLNVPYFKAASEHSTFLENPNKFKLQLEYSDPRVLDLLRQTGYSVIFDRGYPSEWVYAKLLNRPTNTAMLDYLDTAYYELGAKIVICTRKDFTGIRDDIRPDFGPEVLAKQAELYDRFLYWTKVRAIRIEVDDYDLQAQTEKIRKFLGVTATSFIGSL